MLNGLRYAGISKTIGKMEKEFIGSGKVSKAVRKVRQKYEI